MNHYENLSREQKEYFLYLATNKEEYEKPNQYLLSGKYYMYRMHPDEYYAYKYARNYIEKYFSSLCKKFGEEKYLDMYLYNSLNGIRDTESSFKKDQNIDLTYNEIYQLFLNNYIKQACIGTNITEEEMKIELQHSKTLTKK